MLPNLPEVVGRRTEWRAVIICDESGLNQKNPFDLVDYNIEKYEGSIIGEIDEDSEAGFEEFKKKEHEKLLSAYQSASKNPLTRLVTFFCDGPTVTSAPSELENDPDYERYCQREAKKNELRSAIRADEHLLTSKPSEIICVAKRTLSETGEDYQLAWTTHHENEYSRFYDRNMYFDKMRYVLFDILPRTQRNYSFDCVRFLYATMLIASNDIPFGTLNPNRVYNLECENDEAALRNLLYSYEAKLDITKEMLYQRIKEIEEKTPVRLTDEEASQIFSSRVNIPVVIPEGFDRDELYVSKKGIGLAGDCPKPEEDVWSVRFARSKKNLHKFLKQSRRALNRAVKMAHDEAKFDLSSVKLLNEYQIEDINEIISSEEAAMVAMDTPDLYNEEEYISRLNKQSRSVRNTLEKRMSKIATVVIGLLTTLAFAIGFFTLFYKNFTSNAFNFTTSLLFALISVGAFAVVAFIVLFFLRRSVTGAFGEYNNRIKEIDNDVESAMSVYSVYLSHACNVRRGYDILDASIKKISPEMALSNIYRKHILDIEHAKAQSRELFGHFLTEECDLDFSNMLEYDFNFEKPMDYVYPVPYADSRVRNIDFLKSGMRVEIPVDFVRNISVRREELYE